VVRIFVTPRYRVRCWLSILALDGRRGLGNCVVSSALAKKKHLSLVLTNLICAQGQSAQSCVPAGRAIALGARFQLMGALRRSPVTPRRCRFLR
jgi:hypothetical protein